MDFKMNPSGALDEQLIHQVERHAVIYNRQKYFLNNGSPAKYESKDEAWNSIARKLGTDIESCKKRWKYLRERYVQQRKQQSDTPIYEHLSRPYLEKMKFLDDHIQPRKSYKNNYLSSSASNNTPFGEFIDSSRSNGSVNSALYPNYHDNMNIVKCEPEQTFHNFSVSNSNDQQQSHGEFPLNSQQEQQHQQHQQQQQQHHQQQQQLHHQQSLQQNQPQNLEFREGSSVGGGGGGGGSSSHNIPSSSSSLKSPLSSPPAPECNENGDRGCGSGSNTGRSSTKRPRMEIPHETIDDDENEDGDGDSSNNDEPQMRNSATPRYAHRRNSTYSNPNSNFLYSFYQQFPLSGQARCTEQLFGELVTSELLKMNRDKRRIVQKRILEVLFFDD